MLHVRCRLADPAVARLRFQRIIAYCRDLYRVLADEALTLLAKEGWQAARLAEDVAELQQAGYILPE